MALSLSVEIAGYLRPGLLRNKVVAEPLSYAGAVEEHRGILVYLRPGLLRNKVGAAALS